MEKRKKIKRTLATLGLVMVIFTMFAIPASAMGVNEGSNAMRLRSASNLTAIEVFFKERNSTSSPVYSIVFDVGNAYAPDIGDGLETESALLQASTNTITGGSTATGITQTRFTGEAYIVYSVLTNTGSDVKLLSDYQFSFYKEQTTQQGTQPPFDTSEEIGVYITRIVLIYGQNEIHPYNTSKRYKHAGNDYSYMLTTGTESNATVTHNVEVRRWEYTLYTLGSYHFSNIRFPRSTYNFSGTALPTSGWYASMPYDVLWNTTDTTGAYMQNSIVNVNGINTTYPALESQYQYLMIDSQKTTLTFTEAEENDFVFTFVDWYDRENTSAKDMVLPPYYISYPPYDTGFNIGTFIKDSVGNFLSLELMPNFTLGTILTTILGILLVVAVFTMLAGK